MAALLKLVHLEKTPKGRAKLAHRKSTRPKFTLTGSHLSDLAALQKAIILTPDEARRFDAKRYGYATNPRIPRVNGFSDASQQWTTEGVLFLHHGGRYIK